MVHLPERVLQQSGRKDVEASKQTPISSDADDSDIEGIVKNLLKNLYIGSKGKKKEGSKDETKTKSKSDYACHKCGKLGHFAKECRSKVVASIQAEGKDSECTVSDPLPPEN